MKTVIFFGCLLFYTVFSVKAIVQEGHVNSYYSESNTFPFDYSELTDLVVFGDSYSTVKTNFEDMTYTGKNRSGGNNWPLQLIYMHDMYLWNFASGGAPISNNYISKKEKHEYPLDTQYEIFKSKMTKGKEFDDWKGESTLFAFWFGINDIKKTEKTHNETINKGLAYLFNIMNDSFEEGAKNFLVFNIPPFDRSSEFINKKFKDLPIFIKEFNDGIERKVKEFSSSHPEANVIFYNAFDELDYIYVNHEKYNITEVKKDYENSHSKDSSKFFWNDGLHPGEKVHQYFTEDLHNYLNSISVNKVKFNNSTIRATSHLVKSDSLKNFNNELNHSIFPLIIFILFLFLF